MIKKTYLIGILLLALFVALSVFFILPNEQAPQLQASNITIVFTGDVMLGRGVDAILAEENVFEDLKPIFNRADLVVINLEAPFTNSEKNVKQTIPLKADPKYAHILNDNNIDVACLANNHIMDYGERGFYDCIAALRKYNISYVGAGENLEKAAQPIYSDVDNKKIAIISFIDKDSFLEFSEAEIPAATDKSPGSAPAQWELIKKSINMAKGQSDIVIVTFHYGNEFSRTPNKNQYELSRKCIDEGADLVIGHHPHVLQGIENYKGKLIFYSLGNCVFDAITPACQESMIVEFRISNGNAQVILHPIYITNCCPRIMDDRDAENLLEDLKALSDADISIQDGKGKLSAKI